MAYPGAIERLAPSRSKAEFLERLGLREDIPDHRRLYELMKVRFLYGPTFPSHATLRTKCSLVPPAG